MISGERVNWHASDNREPLLLLFSGGVDSQEAARRSMAAGYRVVALTLDMVGDESMLSAARQAAEALAIEHIVVDVRDEFSHQIEEYFISSYAVGRTPAPCTLCNPLIKWRYIIAKADELGIEKVASGHYFGVERVGHLFYVVRAADPVKDQSYYLWGLPQPTLSRIVTPMRDVIKSEILRGGGSPRESMGVCFLRGRSYGDYLREVAGELTHEGEIVDTQGRVVGRHDGVAFYTIGQKRGLQHSLQGVAIVDIDAQHNRLVVGEDALLYHHTIEIEQALVVDEQELLSSDDISLVVRGLGRNPEGFIKRVEPTERGYTITLSQPAWAVAEGQPLLFYRQNRVLGGGIVCHRA